MQQADMRIGPLDDLTIQFQDQPQHAVRGRVLGTEIDRVAVDLDDLAGRLGVRDRVIAHVVQPLPVRRAR